MILDQAMDTASVNELIDSYVRWIKENTHVSQIGEGTYHEIVTPFFNSSNDSMQIYIKKDGDKFLLSDGGETMANLFLTVGELSKKRIDQVAGICMSFGCSFSNDTLSISSSKKDFPSKKHQLLQAMIRVDDMYMLSSHRIASYFFEDVKSYFDDNQVFYTQKIGLAGKSGYNHTFDFLMQRNQSFPSRFCMVINNPSKQSLASTIFAWEDSKGSGRDEDAQLVTILNDSSKLPKNISDAFGNYNVLTVPWSKKEELIAQLR